MGAPRPKPARLAEKLLQIRLSLGLSQNGLLNHLGLADVFPRSKVSAYESGDREPPLTMLLAYARAVGVSTDVLIDDELDLPGKLVQAARREEARGRPASRPGRKR
ncbi:MAG TPA: helix-turn-helix transcriptional regulator [Pyrinomonadaceae bacterium]|jgi:transcriptional regulator with XRE-family HTH domain